MDMKSLYKEVMDLNLMDDSEQKKGCGKALVAGLKQFVPAFTE